MPCSVEVVALRESSLGAAPPPNRKLNGSSCVSRSLEFIRSSPKLPEATNTVNLGSAKKSEIFKRSEMLKDLGNQ